MPRATTSRCIFHDPTTYPGSCCGERIGGSIIPILVTGTAGFIGSAVAARLLELGEEVVGIDEMNNAYDVRLKEDRLATLRQRPSFRFIRGDITQPELLARAFTEQDLSAVYHLAARAGVRTSVTHPDLYLHANAFGTLQMLEACRRHDVPRMLMASTSSLYGLDNLVPFSESAGTSRPLSPYAASKKAAEAFCATYTHLHGIDTIVPRYFTVYGPRGRPDMSVFRFIDCVLHDGVIQLFGDGEQRRDFTFIDDIVAGTVAAMRHLRGHGIVNLGGDQTHSINELIRTIERQLDRTARINQHPTSAADMPITSADIAKARRFGWEPKVDLDEGVRRTIEWHRSIKTRFDTTEGTPAGPGYPFCKAREEAKTTQTGGAS